MKIWKNQDCGIFSLSLPLLSLPADYGGKRTVSTFFFFFVGLFEDASVQPIFQTCRQAAGLSTTGFLRYMVEEDGSEPEARPFISGSFFYRNKNRSKGRKPKILVLYCKYALVFMTNYILQAGFLYLNAVIWFPCLRHRTSR